MLLIFLMLVAVTESKVLQRREHASQDTANLVSPNNRDIEQIKQFVGELQGFGAKLNARGVEQVSSVKVSKIADSVKARNLQQAILPATTGQGKALDSVAKKLTDISALTARGLENGQVMQTDQISKQFGSLKSLKGRNLQEEFSRLGKNVNQIEQIKKNLESLRSANAWHWIPRDTEIKEKISKDLGKLSSVKQGTEIDVKQRDQTINNLGKFSSDWWWFPWEQGTELNLKLREQAKKDLVNLSPDVVWFPWKQGLTKLGRDAGVKGFGTKSLNPFSNGWNWKKGFMPISEKADKERGTQVRKSVNFATEAYKEALLSMAGGEVKNRRANFRVGKKHVSSGENSDQKRGSVEKVGDCYYVCDDVCDPVCHTECELYC